MAISSDEDEDATPPTELTDSNKDDEPPKPQKRNTGKLKSVKKSTSKVQQPTPANSTQDGSSQKSPGKTKVTKAKNKTAVKDQPKTNGRPIYSFFNAATQRQQLSWPSASPEKPCTPREEPEAIYDDSEDEQGRGVSLTKGSSTALAVRKRKVQQSESFENDAGLSLPSSQKFRKASSGDRVPSLSIINEDKRPWTEQFAPRDLSELAVHKRKVADVRQWLELTFSGLRQKVLVLKGAAGTGKTTTVRLLAEDLGYELTEWKNPAGADLVAEGTGSASAQFEDFIGRAGRNGGLQFTRSDGSDLHIDDEKHSGNWARVLLIEEFPNTFSRSSNTLQSWRSAILQYLSSPTLVEEKPTPIVMIISETLLSTNTALADSFTAHRLLGPELVNHPYLDTIDFNAVAQTILTKSLENIVVKEARKSGRRKTPGPQVLKYLAEGGDIRSAISSLEFLCLRGDDGDAWSSKVTFTRQKKAKSDPPLTKSEEEALRLISNRESTLGIFHAVGKVVYNKRIAPRSAVAHPPTWLSKHGRDQVPENDVDGLIDELGTDIPTFTASLHENYALSCSSTSPVATLDSLVGCIGNISDADLLSLDRFSFGTRAFSGSAVDSLRQDEIAFLVAVRGLLFSLPCPVHRTLPADGKRGDAHKMFYPSSLKLWKNREEIEGVMDLLMSKSQAGDLSASSQAFFENGGGSAKGVDSWKRNSGLDAWDDPLETKEPTSANTSSAKMEMLVERLPYMAQILESKRTSSTVMDQVAKVTRIRGSAPVDKDEESDEDEDGDADAEHWTTDQPDVELAAKTGTRTAKLKRRRATKGTESDGLAIPVESRVEKLVLEDDDIVDD